MNKNTDYQLSELDKVYLDFMERHQSNLEDIVKDSSATLGKLFSVRAKNQPDNIALIFEDQEQSYQQLDEWSNAIAHYLINKGLVLGDSIGIATGNIPEFVALFLACSKLGINAALLNTSLKGAALAHTVNLIKPKVIFTTEILSHAFAELVDNLPTSDDSQNGAVSSFLVNELSSEIVKVEQELALQNLLTLFTVSYPVLANKASLMTDLCCIYTSGTTGLPKSAQLNNLRIVAAGIGASLALDLNTGDKNYVCLPLFHTAGLMSGLAATFLAGASLIIKRKFSVSQFWQDCIKYDAHHFIYIGDICKFLLNASDKNLAQKAKIKTCFGNGMLPDVWRQFKQDFAIGNIVEFYSATESNVTLINLTGKTGAVGYIPEMVKSKLGVKLFKYDVEMDELVSDENGCLIECEAGDVGEIMGKITPDSTHKFYTDDHNLVDKIIDNGTSSQRYFRTGDLLKTDEKGWFYFVDRLGDTFRWRGENVSTSEVEATLRKCQEIEDVCVYGVDVPNESGKAGMVSLVLVDNASLHSVNQYIQASLPKYARPLFIRLKESIDKTDTFKTIKRPLQKQGFNPMAINDPIFCLLKNDYVPMDETLFDAIQLGKVLLS